ncbi:MAG: hypothetical protein EXR37_03995 [Limnohabitans sp.]|nr:hypothetical protein [Limnohabitans sp.]
MNTSTTSNHPGSAPTLADWIFILIVIGVVALVYHLGAIAFEHAQQTEKSKRNGEALVKWFTETSTKRFSDEYPIKACAGSGDPKTSTWGACLEYLQANEFKNMTNPFNGKAPAFIDQCNPSDKSLAGEIILLKMVSTPPGSAVSSISSKLMPEDSIDQKLQLSIGICDKGSYLVKVADTEF